MRANRGQVLFVPRHLQELFGVPDVVDISFTNALIYDVTLTRDMCKYLCIDESFEGLTGMQLELIQYFNEFINTLAGYDGSSETRRRDVDKERRSLATRAMSIKHPIVSDLLLRVTEGNADAIETFTMQTKNFDKHQLERELEVPEFEDTDSSSSSDTYACGRSSGSDYADTDLDTGDDEEEHNDAVSTPQCHVVRVSQGEYSSEESKTIATFTDQKRARKLVKRLDKVVFSHHPLDDYRVVGKKLLKIHPKALLRRRQNIQHCEPTYYIETVNLIQS